MTVVKKKNDGVLYRSSVLLYIVYLFSDIFPDNFAVILIVICSLLTDMILL